MVGSIMRMSPLPVPSPSLPFAVSLRGATAVAEPLGAALAAQWAYGFPLVPKPAPQLTHGFLQHPAGMQAVAASNLLRVLPDGVLLDPFVGGGTTLVEGLRHGRKVLGADVSPFALFASAHHAWLASDDDIEVLREQSRRAILSVDPSFESSPRQTDAPISVRDGLAGADAPQEKYVEAPPARRVPKLERAGKGKTTFKSWEPLKVAIEQVIVSDGGGTAGEPVEDEGSPTELSPLWFCYAAAQQRSERYRFTSPIASFDATVNNFCEALLELRDAAPAAHGADHAVQLLHCDARRLSLADAGLPLADAILTSPPYAGVYDYLSNARELRARLGAESTTLMGVRGTPTGRDTGRDWPLSWRSSHEMGARKAMRKTRERGAFAAAWQADQLAWMGAMHANLRMGGRAALLVGDGESEIDALESTATAADAVGLTLVASASIESTAKSHHRHKGRRRPEHVLLLEKA
jgi:hypothetical protein